MPAGPKGKYIMKKLKKIPYFNDEDEESKFWSTKDSADYIKWHESKKVIFPNLKPASKSIPVRFPVSIIERLKLLANKRHIPYQSLLKIFLSERLQQELHR